MNAMLAMITGIVASPSSPSVRFTALPNADDRERIAKTM